MNQWRDFMGDHLRVEQGFQPCSKCSRAWIGFSRCGTYHHLEQYLGAKAPILKGFLMQA